MRYVLLIILFCASFTQAQVSTYTFSTLPTCDASTNVGTIVRLSDNLRGLWWCNGRDWQSISGSANLKDFGATGSAQETTGSINSGSTSLTLASAIDLRNNNWLSVAGAASGGARLISWIVSGGGTTSVTLNDQASTTVSSAVVFHDATTPTRDAMSAVAANKVGKVIAPDGTYYIHGVATGVTGFKSRLPMPIQDYGTSFQPFHITIEGISAHPTMFGTIVSSGNPMSTRGAVFKSLDGGDAMFGGSASTQNFTPAHLTLRNLTLQFADNPSQKCVDGSYLGGLFLENVIAGTGKYTTNITQPTNTSGVCIITPITGNAADHTFRHVQVSGFHTGLQFSEHTDGDYLIFAGNKIGMEGVASAHASYFKRVSMMNNTYNVKVSGHNPFTIAQLNIEHASNAVNGSPSWQDTIYDYDDILNQGRGLTGYYIVEASAGAPVLKLNQGLGPLMQFKHVGENLYRGTGAVAHGMCDNTAPADQKCVQMRVDGGKLNFRRLNDAVNAFTGPPLFLHDPSLSIIKIQPKLDIVARVGQGSDSSTMRLASVNDDNNASRKMELDASEINFMAGTSSKMAVKSGGVSIGGGSNVAFADKSTVTINPTSIPANTVQAQIFTLNGAAVGDMVDLNPPTGGLTTGLIVHQVFISANNVVQVVFQNTTGNAIDEPSGTWVYRLIR